MSEFDLSALQDSLTMLQSLGILTADDSAKAGMVIRQKEKKQREQYVFEHHLGAQGNRLTISQVKVNRNGKEVLYWQTRTPWKGNKHSKIMKQSYDDLISELYEHYSGHKITNISSVRDCYQKWIEHRKSIGNVSSLTIVHNSADWERYIEGRELTEREEAAGKLAFPPADFIDKRISDVKASDIRRFYERLTGMGLITKRTFSNLRSVLNGVFSYAYSNDIECIDILKISCSGLKFKYEEDHSEDVYTPDERNKLLLHLQSLPKQTVYTLSIQLLFCLCCRISELRALKYTDIVPRDSDSAPSYVWFRHQIVDLETEDVKRKPTDVDYMKSHSTAGKRRFPLSAYALEVIAKLKQLNPDSEYICGTKNGKPFSTNHFNEKLRKYCKDAGIRYFSSHKMRFYSISAMYDNGVPENTIQRLAGHSNVSTTRHYNRKLREYTLDADILELGFGSPKTEEKSG